MYGIALSVASCLRAGTAVDVAWIVGGTTFPGADATDAVAITPGGGRMGGLLGGALDGRLAEVAGRSPTLGRLLDVGVGEVDALIAGLPHGGSVTCAVVPATALPGELWPALVAREPVCLVAARHGDELRGFELFTASTAGDAPEPARALLGRGGTRSEVAEAALTTVFHPVPKLVIAGGGPIADALAAQAPLLGWQVVVARDPDTAVGVTATLSPLDHLVLIQHDVEAAGRVLAAALESPVGYIGALGSAEMQTRRADWLAYRGITDTTRLHGPAGLPIGAVSPAEVAVAILAEAIAVTRLAGTMQP